MKNNVISITKYLKESVKELQTLAAFGDDPGSEHAILEMRKKYLCIADIMFKFAVKALENLEIDEMTPRDILEFIKYSVELDRSIRAEVAADIAEIKPDDGFIEALMNTAADDWSEWGKDVNLAG